MVAKTDRDRPVENEKGTRQSSEKPIAAPDQPKERTQGLAYDNNIKPGDDVQRDGDPELGEPQYRKRRRPRVRRHSRAETGAGVNGTEGTQEKVKPTKRPMVEPKDTLLDITEVVARVGMARSSIYVQMRLENFPLPIRVSPRAIRWIGSEIEDWINSRPRAIGEIGNWRLKKKRQ